MISRVLKKYFWLAEHCKNNIVVYFVYINVKTSVEYVLFFCRIIQLFLHKKSHFTRFSVDTIP